MSTVGQTAFTLNDWKKRMEWDGTVADIIEIMNQANPIMDHILWKQSNLLTGNKITQRTSIPEPEVRMINQGVSIKKSDTEQITDTIVLLESRSQLDKAEADLAPNKDELRKSEDSAAIEGFVQKVAKLFIYGDIGEDAKVYNGFEARQRVLGVTDPSKAGYTTISNSGSTANSQCSAYFVDWNDHGAYGIFPRNGKAGLDMEDKGLQRIQNGNKVYDAYETVFNWAVGLSVADPRSIGRLCNVEPSTIISGTAAQKLAFFGNFLKVHDRMRRPEHCKIYVGSELYTALKVFLSDKNNSYVTYDTLANGIKQLYVDGVPVFRLDAVKNTEAVVS